MDINEHIYDFSVVVDKPEWEMTEEERKQFNAMIFAQMVAKFAEQMIKKMWTNIMVNTDNDQYKYEISLCVMNPKMAEQFFR